MLTRSMQRGLFVTLCTLFGGVLPAQGKVFLSAAEALKLAFPKAKVERQKHVLNEAKKSAVHKLSGHKARRSMVIAYVATDKQGKRIGTAYFDRHRVRSKQELLMVVLDANGAVKRIEILAFGEPVDYLPRATFYAQFVGSKLDDKLSTKGKIRSVVGCTLTVNATLASVRRLLAVHQVVFAGAKPRQGPKQVSAKRASDS